MSGGIEPAPARGNLVWIDLEMTGLDPERDVILEAAVLITDAQLNIIAHGPEIAVHRSAAELAVMDAWNRRTHGASGLLERVRKSDLSAPEAEDQILEFIQAWTFEAQSPLAGNSVHQDKRFLVKEMPRVAAWLHYRIVDVSTVKELADRWYPNLEPFVKQQSHRAFDDIRESIEELIWYRRQIFVPPNRDDAANLAPPERAAPPPDRAD